MAQQTETATFGAGCYWGTEKFFRKNFEKLFPGAVKDVQVGFMGGKADLKENSESSYREVCSGATGHVEVAQLVWDPSKASYEQVVKFFFTFHDPTTLNRQGNDRGTQYASVIFSHSDEQSKVAGAVIGEVQKLIDSGKIAGAYDGNSVKTDVRPASKFIPAHKEHQDYLNKNPRGYCNHGIRFTWEKAGGKL